MKHTSLIAAAAFVLQAASALADVVYVTARPSPSGTGPNPNGTYAEVGVAGSDTSAAGTAAGVPARTGCRFFSNSFSNAIDGVVGFRVTPTLGVPGGVYQIHHNFDSQTGGNVSTNISLSVTCSFGGTLSFVDTGTNFVRASGTPRTQWKFLGYLTNNVGSATPSIEFGYLSGIVNAGASQRLLVDTFRFTLYEPCVDIPPVGVTGPLSANVNQVVVSGVTAGATNVIVYQDSGSGMVAIGTNSTSVAVGNTTVAVSGLVKGAIVAATQTINGQEGCVPASGTLVGGGSNPRIRVALSIRETSSTGPVGAAGNTASANIHFLGASALASGSPADGLVVYPSNTWQTIQFDRGTVRIPGPTSSTGVVSSGTAYPANSAVTVRVYSTKVVPETGVQIYSATPAQTLVVTSNDAFNAEWSWAPVADSQGYRLLRDVNGAGFNDFVDVFATSFTDLNSSWSTGTNVSPSLSQTNISVQWNGGVVGTLNSIAGNWGILEAIAFVIDDLSDTGPYDLYIDNLKNGATTWQNFEGSVAGATGVGFQAPGFSGTTSGNLLAAPNTSTVSNGAADTGNKSLRVRFQWANTNSTRWLRLTTSAAGNPQVTLDEPISFRLLLLPVGSAPVAPPAPSLSASLIGGQAVLSWTNAHRLQTSTNVAGPFTNITSVTTAPWTNSFLNPELFFRLVD